MLRTRRPGPCAIPQPTAGMPLILGMPSATHIYGERAGASPSRTPLTHPPTRVQGQQGYDGAGIAGA